MPPPAAPEPADIRLPAGTILRVRPVTVQPPLVPGTGPYYYWGRALLALTALSAVLLPHAAAQPPDEAAPANRAVLRGEANPDIARTLAAARAAATASDWPAAARHYLDLLDKFPDAVVATGDGIYAGVADVVLREIAAGAPGLAAACNELAAPRAAADLGAAALARDDAGLLAVIDRYPFTEAAGKAFARLARRHLEAGRLPDAAGLADRLPRLAPGEASPEAVAALGLALAAARDRARLEALWDRAHRDARLRDGRVAPDGRGQALPAFLEGLVRAAPPAAARAPDDGVWAQLGGDASHTRLMDALPDVPRPLRSFPLAAGPAPGAPPRGADFPVQASDPSLFPPYFPAVAEGLCYVATERTVTALNAFLAEAPGGDAPAAPPAPEADDALVAWRHEVPAPDAYAPDDRTTQAVTVHRGIVYAPLVTDVSDGEYQLYFFVKYPFARRALVALDAWTGRQLWRLGGRDGAADFLDAASFALPPTADGDALYAGVSHQQHATDPFGHHVVCLDAATGRLRWRTYISQGFHEVNLFNNPIRDAMGTPVAVAGDTVYYGTNLGCVAALDRLTGRLRWVRKYEQVEVQPPRSVNVFRQRLRWTNNPPIVAAGTLCVSPLDSPFAYGLDAATGELRWRIEWPGDQGEQWRHFAGVKDGLLYVSGRTLLAVDLAAGGRRRWVYAPPGESGTGRGGVTADAVLFPTDRGLHRVDPATGRPLGFRPWASGAQQQGANVVSAGGALFTASGDLLTIHGDPAAFRAFGAGALERDPDNLMLRYRVASAALAAGRGEEAERELRECLRRAAEKAGDPDAARVASLCRARLFQRLAAAAVDAARPDPAGARTRFAEARGFAEPGAAVREQALRLADALRDGRHWVDAVAAYQEVIDAAAGDAPEPAGDAAAARAIDRILAVAGREPYAPFEARARARLEEARRAPSVERFEAVAAAHPNSLAAREARLAALAIHEQAEAWEPLAAAARAFLREAADAPQAAEAARALVAALERRGQRSEAKRVLRQMTTRWKGRTVRDGGRDMPAEAFAAARLAQPAYQRVAAAGGGPEIQPPLASAWEHAAARGGRAAPRAPGAPPRAILQSQILPVADAEDSGAAGLLVLAVDGAVQAVDAVSGRPRWEYAFGALPRAAAAVDDILIVVSDTRVVGLRVGTGEPVWRYSASGAILRHAPAAGLFVLASAEPGASGQTRLVALDAAAGRPAWTAAFPGFPASELFAFEDHLAVVAHPPARLLTFDATTGHPAQEILVGEGFANSAVFLAPDRLALLAADGRIRCLRPATGETVWEASLGGQRLILPPAAAGPLLALYVAGPRGLEILGLDAATGKRVIAASDLPAPNKASPSLVATDGTMLYAVLRVRDTSGVLVKAFGRTGDGWTFAPEGTGPGTAILPPVFARDHVVLPLARYDVKASAWAGRAAVLDKATGRLVQELEPPPDSPSRGLPQVTVVNGTVVLLSDAVARGFRGK